MQYVFIVQAMIYSLFLSALVKCSIEKKTGSRRLAAISHFKLPTQLYEVAVSADEAMLQVGHPKKLPVDVS